MCIKNADVIDIAFIFPPVFLENVTHAVTAGMENMFIYQYVYKDKYQVQDDMPVFASFVILDLFDDPFPTCLGWNNCYTRAMLELIVNIFHKTRGLFSCDKESQLSGRCMEVFICNLL